LIERELAGCTFYPNNMLEREEEIRFNPDEFYKKHIEWKKRKEAEAIRKQEENLSSIMVRTCKITISIF